MVANGLLGECMDMYQQGIRAKSNCASNGIGYRQGLDFVHEAFASGGANINATALKKLVTEIQSNTRMLTRRQNTWFRGDPLFRWVFIEKDDQTASTSGSKAADQILESFHSDSPPAGGNFLEFEMTENEKKEMKRYVSQWLVMKDKASLEKVVQDVKSIFDKAKQ